MLIHGMGLDAHWKERTTPLAFGLPLRIVGPKANNSNNKCTCLVRQNDAALLMQSSGLLRNWRDWMKALDLRDWPGANRSDSRSYREDEQQRQARKDKLSCRVNYEADH
jgi:hypothetical protein